MENRTGLQKGGIMRGARSTYPCPQKAFVMPYQPQTKEIAMQCALLIIDTLPLVATWEMPMGTLTYSMRASLECLKNVARNGIVLRRKKESLCKQQPTGRVQWSRSFGVQSPNHSNAGITLTQKSCIFTQKNARFSGFKWLQRYLLRYQDPLLHPTHAGTRHI